MQCQWHKCSRCGKMTPGRCFAGLWVPRGDSLDTTFLAELVNRDGETRWGSPRPQVASWGAESTTSARHCSALAAFGTYHQRCASKADPLACALTLCLGSQHRAVEPMASAGSPCKPAAPLPLLCCWASGVNFASLSLRIPWSQAIPQHQRDAQASLTGRGDATATFCPDLPHLSMKHFRGSVSAPQKLAKVVRLLGLQLEHNTRVKANPCRRAEGKIYWSNALKHYWERTMELSQNGISHTPQIPARDSGLTNSLQEKARTPDPSCQFHNPPSCTYHHCV